MSQPSTRQISAKSRKKVRSNPADKSINQQDREADKITTSFRDNAAGSKGITERLKNFACSQTIKIATSESDYFLQKTVLNQPIYEDLKSLEDHYISQSLHWLWMSLLHRNILIYGLGNKRQFLSSFVEKHLHGEDVLSISGATASSVTGASSERVVKSLINTIHSRILSVRQPPSCWNLLSAVSQASLLTGQQHCILKYLLR